MMYGLSVIIPVYNTRRYLDECVNSVLNQNIKDLEIILVDDESPDGAGKRCDELAEIFSSIKVIHKKNQGLGLARNTGLEIATGKYVTFLDSDDYIRGDYYNSLIEKADELSADICFSIGYYNFNQEKRSLVKCDYLKDVVFDSNEECNQQMSRMISRSAERDDGISGSSCFGIYRLAFLNENNLRFKSEREYLSEDIWFNMDCFHVANCVGYCDVIGYHYRYNDRSLSRGYRENRFKQLVSFTAALKHKCKEYHCVDYYSRICVYYWINLEKCINQEVRFNKENGVEKLKDICEHETSREVLSFLKDKPYPEGFHKLLCMLLYGRQYRLVKVLLSIYNTAVH